MRCLPVQEQVIERCREVEGVVIGEGAFAPGPAVWVGEREVAHFDVGGGLDVRLTKDVIRHRRAELARDDRVSFRTGASDWIAINITEPADLDWAVALVGDAVTANIGTARPGSPPTGAALERRRRFH